MDAPTDIWIDIVRALGVGGLTTVAVGVGYVLVGVILWIMEG